MVERRGHPDQRRHFYTAKPIQKAPNPIVEAADTCILREKEQDFREHHCLSVENREGGGARASPSLAPLDLSMVATIFNGGSAKLHPPLQK